MKLKWKIKPSCSLLLSILLTSHLRAEELPSVEMLEFLGGWEDNKGESLDPLEWFEFFEDAAAEETETADTEASASVNNNGEKASNNNKAKVNQASTENVIGTVQPETSGHEDDE